MLLFLIVYVLETMREIDWHQFEYFQFAFVMWAFLDSWSPK